MTTPQNRKSSPHPHTKDIPRPSRLFPPHYQTSSSNLQPRPTTPVQIERVIYPPVPIPRYITPITRLHIVVVLCTNERQHTLTPRTPQMVIHQQAPARH